MTSKRVAHKASKVLRSYGKGGSCKSLAGSSLAQRKGAYKRSLAKSR